MQTSTAKSAGKKEAALKKPVVSKKVAKPAAKSLDALAQLKDDHKRVKKMFKEFEKIKGKAEESEKQALVQQICRELSVHAQVEEEIFYPAVRKAIDDQDLLDEAAVEHASAKDLIQQLQSMSPSDALYDAKVTVLGEYVDHHVQEEETELFKKAKKAKMDMEKLGKKLGTRKRAILRELQLQ